MRRRHLPSPSTKGRNSGGADLRANGDEINLLPWFCGYTLLFALQVWMSSSSSPSLSHNHPAKESGAALTSAHQHHELSAAGIKHDLFPDISSSPVDKASPEDSEYVIWTRRCTINPSSTFPAMFSSTLLEDDDDDDDDDGGGSGGVSTRMVTALRIHGVQDRHYRYEAEGNWLDAAIQSKLLECSDREQFSPIAWETETDLSFNSSSTPPNGAVHLPSHGEREILHLCWSWKDLSPAHKNDVIWTEDDTWFKKRRRIAGKDVATADWRIASRVKLFEVLKFMSQQRFASLLVSVSLHPDYDRGYRGNIRKTLSWIYDSGFHSQNTLLLHYRLGDLLAPGSRDIRLFKEGDGDDGDKEEEEEESIMENRANSAGAEEGTVAQEGEGRLTPPPYSHPAQAFWNNYWWMLLLKAEKHPANVCRTSGRHEDPIHSEPSSSPSSSSFPSSSSSANSSVTAEVSTFLILGGDARPVRVDLLWSLHRANYLKDARWSLQTPKDCGGESPFPPLDVDVGDFCKEFPRNLDIDVGNFEDKDKSFPDTSLYRTTRLSVVFESVLNEVEDRVFLTEKVLKPIFGGHPFILLGAGRYAYKALRAFGFETFGRVIDEGFGDMNLEGLKQQEEEENDRSSPSHKHHHQHQQQFISPGKSRIFRMLSAIQRLEKADWEMLERIADKNREHLMCGGFRHRLQSQLQMILRRIMATTASTREMTETRTATTPAAAASSKRGEDGGEETGKAQGQGRGLSMEPEYASVFSLMTGCQRHSSEGATRRPSEKDGGQLSHCRRLISSSTSWPSSLFDDRVGFFDAWTVR